MVMTDDYLVSDNGQVALDVAEREAMDALLHAYNLIRSWGLNANSQELTAAVHVCQGFIVQRMLQRLNPDEWGCWYGDEGARG